MRADPVYFSVIKNDDLIRIHDGCYSLRNDNFCDILPRRQCLADLFLRCRVDRTCRIIEDQDFCLSDQRTRDAETLLLSACGNTKGKEMVDASTQTAPPVEGVTALALCDGDVTLRFEKDETGAWTWFDDPAFPLDQTALEDLLALPAAMLAGACSGFVTAFLQTKLGVESILAGIIVNTGLYTINLAVMGFSSTMSLVKTETIFSLAKKSLGFLGSWYKLVLVGVIITLACAAMLGFLGTRLGLSIRATGDNAAMVRASSINPAFTITVGLCISGALTALSGGLLAQYQKSCDINVGTGMVTIALASLIIGETLVGKRTMVRRVLGVVFGSCLYRFIVAVALRFNVPAAAMKLVSAIIVAVAISMPAIQEKIAFEKRRNAARQARKERV